MRRLNREAELFVQCQIDTNRQSRGLALPQLTAKSAPFETRQQSPFSVVCGPVVPELVVSCGGGYEEGCVCVVKRIHHGWLVMLFSQLERQHTVSDIESAMFPMIPWVAVVSLNSCGLGWSHPERMGMTWVLGRQEHWEPQHNIEPGCFRECKMHAQLSSPGRSCMSVLWQRGYKQGLWIQTALGWDPWFIVYLLCNLEQLI